MRDNYMHIIKHPVVADRLNQDDTFQLLGFCFSVLIPYAHMMLYKQFTDFFNCRKIEKNSILNDRYFKDLLTLKFKSYFFISHDSKCWSNPAHIYSVKEITKDLVSLAQSQIFCYYFKESIDSYYIMDFPLSFNNSEEPLFD